MDVVKITKFPEIVTLQTFDCSQLITIFRKLRQVGLSTSVEKALRRQKAIKVKYGV